MTSEDVLPVDETFGNRIRAFDLTGDGQLSENQMRPSCHRDPSVKMKPGINVVGVVYVRPPLRLAAGTDDWAGSWSFAGGSPSSRRDRARFTAA